MSIADRLPLRFQLRARSGAWHLRETTRGWIGGVFRSRDAALAFVKREAAGAIVVVDDGTRRTAA
jgi:hypothetical protein